MSTESDKPEDVHQRAPMVAPLTVTPTTSGKAGLQTKPPLEDDPHGRVARQFENWQAETRDAAKT